MEPAAEEEAAVATLHSCWHSLLLAWTLTPDWARGICGKPPVHRPTMFQAETRNYPDLISAPGSYKLSELFLLTTSFPMFCFVFCLFFVFYLMKKIGGLKKDIKTHLKKYRRSLLLLGLDKQTQVPEISQA